ncbi:MAG: NTP transferase domain-containing protein [Candidatus Pacearchaeota archaeon]|jgi:2-aminoethylphosphonate-pyruvate transaminase|nr:NTP transferase domain-containing protein [Clostridia bacterium]
MKTAIILAAGLGSRVGLLTETMPKGFLRICGKSLIEMSVENLLKKGYEKILIVTGHKSEYYEKFAKGYKEVSTIHNGNYVDSGSGYSLYVGLKEVKGACTIVESDILYDAKILDHIGNDKDIIVTSFITKDHDEVYVESFNNCMSNVSKLTSDLENHEHSFLGISHISANTVNNVLLPFAEDILKNNPRIEYEHVLVKATKKYGVQFNLEKTDYVWCEIDDLIHYYKAVNRVFPLLYNIL